MIRVKPLNIDTSPKYSYRVRTTLIKISSSKSITTPIRAITNSEMKAKETIPTPVDIDAEIGNILIHFTNGKIRNIQDFISKDKKYNDIRKHIIKEILKMQYFDLKYVLLQPTSSALDYLQTSDKITEKFIRLQYILQKDLEEYGLDIITIPWLNLSPDEFKQLHKHFAEENPNKVVMPVIDPKCNENHLKEILEYIVSLENTDMLNLVGIYYRQFDNYRVSYDTIWEYLYDCNIGTILINTHRQLLNKYNISGVHYGEFIVGDVLSSYVGIGRGESNEKDQNKSQKKKKPIELKFKFFRKESLDIVPLLDIIQTNPSKWVDDIVNEIGEKDLKKPLEYYYEAENNSEKKAVINAISKVHEFKCSRNEIISSQKYIQQNDTVSYIQEKKILHKLFASSQLRLNGFL